MKELQDDRQNAQNEGQSVGEDLKKEFLRNLGSLSEMLNTRIQHQQAVIERINN